MREFPCPETLRVDAYQAGHFEMIPPGMDNFECSQGIFRKPLAVGDGEPADHRLISAGVAPFIALNLEQPVTADDLEQADEFFADFHAQPAPPYRHPYPWPREMFSKIVEQYAGRLPVVVTALPDGQTHYVCEPHLQVWTDEPGMGECVGWIESSLLPYVWTSSLVATRGRRRKERMLEVFRRCYPGRSAAELLEMIAFKFHDFGRRAGASTQITGIAHLLNWLGTDTCDAAYAATRYLNDGKKFGACSIVAAAHRTITPWSQEIDAYRRMVENYGRGLFSVVADSYDFHHGLELLGSFADKVKVDGGVLIARADSGDPVDSLLVGLRVFEQAFGCIVTEGGLKVLNHAALLQGDGVSDSMIFDRIYPAMIAAGYCPSNVAFGMGEHNHEGNRSETEIAYKTSLVGTADSSASSLPHATAGYRAVMKASDSPFKRSLPGPVRLDFSGAERGMFCNRVQPIDVEQLRRGETGELVVLYDGRPRPLPVQRELFEQSRERALRSWDAHTREPGDTFDPEIRRMQEQYLTTMRGS